MISYTFDANIIIDALAGHDIARVEIARAAQPGSQAWISRMVWIEVLSKRSGTDLSRAERLLAGFELDEIDGETADRAAALRRARVRLKSPDAIILASALVRGRVLVTRNTRDFSPDMPGVRVPYTL